MGSHSGIARGLVKYESKGVKRLTLEGQEEMEELLKCGCTEAEIADYFCLDIEEIKAFLAPDGQCYEMGRYCRADLKKRVRQMQLDVGANNAAAAKLLGMHILGQPKEPAPEEPDGAQRVIDGMPNRDMTPDEWLHQFGPRSADQRPVSEQLKDLAQAGEDGAQ